MTVDTLIEEFSTTHNLPESFRKSASEVYWPLLNRLISEANAQSTPLLVGVHGSQGSGKSTLTEFLLYACQHAFGISATGFSLDDFYLTRQERVRLSERRHPLLRTRGVPGTHDIALLSDTLNALFAGHTPVSIPVFNKALDDREPRAEWQQITQKPEIILFEGWCVGSTEQVDAALDVPVNELEKSEDPDGDWRGYVNDQLRSVYKPLFQRLDRLIMLRAPSFSAVKQWRQEQEDRLVAKLRRLGQPTDEAMSPDQIARFIQHYQRITEHSLQSLPKEADYVLSLNTNRQILSVDGPI